MLNMKIREGGIMEVEICGVKRNILYLIIEMFVIELILVSLGVSLCQRDVK